MPSAPGAHHHPIPSTNCTSLFPSSQYYQQAMEYHPIIRDCKSETYSEHHPISSLDNTRPPFYLVMMRCMSDSCPKTLSRKYVVCTKYLLVAWRKKYVDVHFNTTAVRSLNQLISPSLKSLSLSRSLGPQFLSIGPARLPLWGVS